MGRRARSDPAGFDCDFIAPGGPLGQRSLPTLGSIRLRKFRRSEGDRTTGARFSSLRGRATNGVAFCGAEEKGGARKLVRRDSRLDRLPIQQVFYMVNSVII